jgi:pyrroloquinoline quinone (PQQ) biosynthesis protein C
MTRPAISSIVGTATGYHPRMIRTEIEAVLAEVLRDRRLLDHPFYRRWEAGTLEPGELAAYAGQYRHFEAALPAVLAQVADGVDDPTARRLVQANLDDERGDPVPHIELFEGFAASVGATGHAAATPATDALVALYTSASTGPATGALAALAAYEVQAPGIAASKAEGLRTRYGLDAGGTRFWDVHATADEAHGAWLVDAIAALDGDRDTVEVAATAAAAAWWSFLDEREAQRPAGVAC